MLVKVPTTLLGDRNWDAMPDSNQVLLLIFSPS
jgi:hypothetical protein